MKIVPLEKVFVLKGFLETKKDDFLYRTTTHKDNKSLLSG